MDNTTRSSSIMVVDDTPQNLELMEQMLNEHGYQVRLFVDGFSAIDSADYDPPDLILLDVMMPEIDGYEVCKRLKENNNTAEIPILFISAKGETFDKIKAFKSGGVDYITKPFQLEEVLARVETHLKLRRYQLELKEKNIFLQDTLNSLKAVQSQLIQSEKMASLGTLTAGIAHEINNPINAINSSSIGLKKLIDRILSLLNSYGEITPQNVDEQLKTIEDIKERIDLDDTLSGISQLLGNIEKGTKRTTDIVIGLRTFTYMDKTVKVAIDVHDNLNTTLALLNHKTQDRINVIKEYGDIPPFNCFPGKMNQVFMNILVNSIDAILAKGDDLRNGEIKIKTTMVNKLAGRFLEIIISDNGTGMPENIVNRIFEPFYTTKVVGKGVGLGLSIAHGIIKSHDGTIDVESKPGIGTTFTIQLPFEEN